MKSGKAFLEREFFDHTQKSKAFNLKKFNEDFSYFEYELTNVVYWRLLSKLATLVRSSQRSQNIKNVLKMR